MASSNGVVFMNMVVVVALTLIIVGVTAATAEVYKVGDSAGWTNIGHVDYKTWASTKKFCVGDTIRFDYNKEFHNVVRVSHTNFRSCNATAPHAVYSSGNDSFHIKRPGHYYFICSLPGHCEAGQKVDIRVQAAAPPHSPAPMEPLPYPGPLSPSHPKSPAPSPPVSPPTLPPSPSLSPGYAPAPSPHKNGSSPFSVQIWLTLVALVFCVFGYAY